MTAADAREARRLAGMAHHFTYGDGADPAAGAALAAEALVYATLATMPEQAPAAAYVYRATWHTTPLGTYTNQAAARTHCMADATNNQSDPASITKFDWIGDDSEPNAPYELLLTIDGAEETTDYTVTRIEVATEYDPEADA